MIGRKVGAAAGTKRSEGWSSCLAGTERTPLVCRRRACSTAVGLRDQMLSSSKLRGLSAGARIQLGQKSIQG
jgi:hypothetical protein